MTENQLSRDLRSAGREAQYDAQVKNILRNKIVLAWILRYTVSSFSQMLPEEIVPYIEAEPQVNRTADAGQEKIRGSAGEDAVPGEGTVVYDIKFWVTLPSGGADKRFSETAKVIINVEAQKKFNPGYCIEGRGVFYCSRMISAQLGTEFQEPHYDRIRKVYSIWLCMNAPKYAAGAIAEYSFRKKDILPGMKDRRWAYDKQAVILICLNKKTAKGNRLTGMLNTLLSQEMDFEAKKEKLEHQYGLHMETRMETEVKQLCNLSMLVKEEGRREGLEMVAMKMLRMKDYGDEEIIRLSEISRKRLEELKAKLASGGGR